MAQSGAAHGVAEIIARAHHGSVSKEQRALIEEDLKAGRLPVRRGHLQPRARHRHGRGRPRRPGRVAAVGRQRPAARRPRRPPGRRGVARRAVPQAPRRPGADRRRGRADAHRARSRRCKVPANPLDVLAQQIVACVAVDTWDADELFDARTPGGVRSRRCPGPPSTPPSTCSSGRYPSDEFAELRPRLVWDRVANTLTGRPGAQRLAVTSGGTIPDRGLFGVFLVGREGGAGSASSTRRWSTSRGSATSSRSVRSSWRIEDITHDRVLVSPAPGQPGRLPFWKGDALGRPAELGARRRRVRPRGGRAARRARPSSARRPPGSTSSRPATWSRSSPSSARTPATSPTTAAARRAVSATSSATGGWSSTPPTAPQVHGPWALAIGARLRERFGIDAQAMAGDDGIVMRIPETDAPSPQAPACPVPNSSCSSPTRSTTW